MNILVTTANYTASIPIMRSLAKKHKLYLIDSNKYTPAFYSRFCTEAIVTPPDDSPDYLEAVVNICNARKIDLIIPISDIATEIFSNNREEIFQKTGIKLFLPSKELIDLAVNKKKTYRWMYDNYFGNALPKTFFVTPEEGVSAVKELAKFINYPCVLKKSRGQAGSGNTYITTEFQLIEHFRYLGLGEKGDWPVIQEFIKGDFYGVIAVAHQGQFVECFMYKASQDQAAKGTAIFSTSVKDLKLLKTADSIIRRLNWSGAINLDFILDKDGIYRLLEINPRLSGSLDFACAAGIDLVEAYRCMAFGEYYDWRKTAKVKESDQYGLRYRSGEKFRQVFFSEILHLIRQKNYKLKFILNFFELNTKDNIYWDDPKLIFWQLKNLRWYLQDIANRKAI